MSIYSLTGNDTFILNDRILNEFTDGSTVEITYSNDRVGISTGKNDNTIFSDNRQGNNATVTLRIVRGGAEDKWLNGLSIQQERDLPSFPLMNGVFTKRVGDGQGNITFDSYTLLGGVFQDFPDVQENLQGETEQGTTVYTLTFAKAQRGLG